MTYDGDCDFCSRWIARWHAMTADSIEYAPYQLLTGTFSHLTCDQFAETIHLIVPNGDTLTGAQAVFRTLSMGARGAGEIVSKDLKRNLFTVWVNALVGI